MGKRFDEETVLTAGYVVEPFIRERDGGEVGPDAAEPHSR